MLKSPASLFAASPLVDRRKGRPQPSPPQLFLGWFLDQTRFFVLIFLPTLSRRDRWRAGPKRTFFCCGRGGPYNLTRPEQVNLIFLDLKPAETSPGQLKFLRPEFPGFRPAEKCPVCNIHHGEITNCGSGNFPKSRIRNQADRLP